jgi:hypothetical protein
MKKLIAVGILIGALALGVMPALASQTTCNYVGSYMYCNTYQPYQPPVQTTCHYIGNYLYCNTY